MSKPPDPMQRSLYPTAISAGRSATRASASALLFALLFSMLAQAQAETLTLERAVALGLERAPQLQAQAAAVDAAHAESVAAGRLPDPELMLGLDNLPVTGQDAWSAGSAFMTMRKVGVMQAFPNGHKRASQRERANAAIAMSQSQAVETQLDVARATAESWIAVHGAELALDALQALRPEVALQAQAAQAALAGGRGSTVDALAARSAISALEDRILDVQREVQAARAELARWIGEDAQRRLAAAPALDALPVPREKLLASLHRHPQFTTRDAQLAIAQAEIDLARATKRPDWSAQLAYAKRGSAFSDMVSLEFRVDLPVFGRYRQDPAIRAGRAQLSRLEAEREADLRAHAAEVASTLAAWESARKRVELYERERLPLARQRSQAALAGFQAGRVTLFDVLASLVAESELQLDYAELIRALGQAWAFLRYLEAEHVQ